ncbi:interleukin-18-binding protein isoform X2 [Hyperolius riggenbachi]|uniref:interleukin-18-binding protein isoform X2 n=1 Tax=Hyperolius riggenbachi TaxID=752182 RepID=UPI0035A38813
MTRSTGAVADSPKIVCPTQDEITAQPGTNITIPCVAHTTLPEFSVVYWLVDKNFIEDMYPDGRVKEEAESLNKTEKFSSVKKSLVFTPTKPEDFNRTFTCVIQDPDGVDVKDITLQLPKTPTTKVTRDLKRFTNIRCKNRTGRRPHKRIQRARRCNVSVMK